MAFRAMCRKQQQIDTLRSKGIDAVLGDFDRPETLPAAMQGCDVMFLVTPASPAQFDQETAAIDAAKRAGVRRIVNLSTSDSNVRSPVPWAQAHARIDHHLRASGLEWTTLKPSGFMQIFLWFKDPIGKGYLPQASGNGLVPWVDSRDVARVAATVLTEDGHERATYFLTGPETLDMKSVAARLSQVVQRKVRSLNLPSWIFGSLLRLTGTSGWMAKGLVVQFSDVQAGHHDIDPTGEIERLTGKPPRNFLDFVSEHRDQFAKAA